jgi:hypothetical protein
MVLAEAIGSVKRNSIKLLLSGFANTDIVGQIPVVVFYLKIAATAPVIQNPVSLSGNV